MTVTHSRPFLRQVYAPILAGLTLLVALLGADPVRAHHLPTLLPMQTSPPLALLSGLFHPLVDPDHLLFLLALSLVELRRPLLWLPVLLLSSFLGSLVGLGLADLPGWFTTVALSLVVEALVAFGRLQTFWLLPALAAHGMVEIGTVQGWNGPPIAAFLVGLLITQAALMVVSLTLLRRLFDSGAEWVRQLLASALLACGLVWTYASLMF